MTSNLIKQEAKRIMELERINSQIPSDKRHCRTTGQQVGDLSFILKITNQLTTVNPVLLWDASGQYASNNPGAPTNDGIVIEGTKKNYQGLLNQLISESYQLNAVNVEVTSGSNSQLDNAVSIWTNSRDNDASIFQKSIVPGLFKNSQQFQLELIETAEYSMLNQFTAWTFNMEPETVYTMRIFATCGVSFM